MAHGVQFMRNNKNKNIHKKGNNNAKIFFYTIFFEICFMEERKMGDNKPPCNLLLS